MRFAFAGIDFLSDVFGALVDAGWAPVQLFTRPCDGVYDFNEEIVDAARRLRLPVQLSRIRREDLERLADAGCDALVVAGYPWRIPDWAGFVPYALNIHPSPLPVGRGPYPLFRAILEDRDAWGVTAHVLDRDFDTGAVLAQEVFPVAPTETHDSLLAKCQMATRRLGSWIARDLPSLWREAQPQGEGSYWPRITDAERTLDWSRDVADAMRQVRAFGSIETIAHIGGEAVFVRAASGWQEPHRYPPGTLVHSHRRHVVVAVRDGFIQITAWSPIALADSRDLGR